MVTQMKFETKLAIGAGLVIGAVGTAWFMKTMVDEGNPEIAKFPIKALDELSQRSKSPENGKAVVTILSKATEALIDERDRQNKQQQTQRRWW